MPKSALFFGISLACLLMVPGMVGEAEAQSAPSIDTSNPVELIIPLTKIHDDPGYSNDPAVVFDGSTVHVAWIDETSPQKIYYKKARTVEVHLEV